MGITVLRCDDRLIHGQCIVKVLNDYKIDYIILVDALLHQSGHEQYLQDVCTSEYIWMWHLHNRRLL